MSSRQELALVQRDIKAMEVTIKTLEVSLTQKMEAMKKDLKLGLGGGLGVAITLIVGILGFLMTVH